jgi:hypothetical protein
MEQFVTAVSSILILALIPGAFVAAYFLCRKWLTNNLGRAFFILIVGIIIFIGGATAIVAGCSSIYPMNFR